MKVLRVLLQNDQKGLRLVALVPSGFAVETRSGERLIEQREFRSLRRARAYYTNAVDGHNLRPHKPEIGTICPIQRRRYQP